MRGYVGRRFVVGTVGSFSHGPPGATRHYDFDATAEEVPANGGERSSSCASTATDALGINTMGHRGYDVS